MLNNDKLFAPLATPEEIARWDAESAASYAVPELALMENAAREAMHVLDKEYGLGCGVLGLTVLVLAGGGNNGGDGVALARHLHNRGCRVLVCAAGSPGKYRGSARRHLLMARKAGVRVEKARTRKGRLLLPASWLENPDAPETLSTGALHSAAGTGENRRSGVSSSLFYREKTKLIPGIVPDIVIDALVGAGFKPPLRGVSLEMVRLANDLGGKGSYVFSLDVPSGLDALEGLPLPEAVRAKATVSFAAAKPGLCLPQAVEYTGRLHVREIGIPAALMRKEPPLYRLLAPRSGVLPKQSLFIHKNDKGRVLVIGGSPGLTGAPACLCAEIKGDSPEIMTLPLGSLGDGPEWQDGHFGQISEFIAQMGEKSALVLGPGLGRSAAAGRLASRIAGLAARPRLVLDADGLFFFRLYPPENPDPASPLFTVSQLNPDDVMTPHPGEMLRLLEGHPALPDGFRGKLRELRPRSECINLFRGSAPGVLLLKGAGTLVAQSGSPISIVPFAEPNLAVGGSGDVLSGIIAALLARGGMADGLAIPSLQAAALGAYIHARAGIVSRIKFPYGGNLASDLASLIPLVLKEVS